MPDLYVVNTGITADDKILLDGIQKANDNDKIKYDYLNPKEVLSHLRLKAE
jgi:membrane fusion protein (multidrug efflux system)